MERKELTRREQDIFNFILEYKNKYGYSPSIREIQKGVFIHSPNMIHRYLMNIVDKGYLEYTPKIARSIVIKIC